MSEGPLVGEILLIKQVTDYIAAETKDILEDAWGDSPIEKLFFAALVTFFRHQPTEFDGGVSMIAPDRKKRMFEDEIYKHSILVEQQVQIKAARVDFVIYAWSWGSTYQGRMINTGEPRWRKLIVECDGHDFHERTKAQAARDKSRDRAHVIEGYDCFRFTGSELWCDPWGCIEQVYNWAAKGI